MFSDESDRINGKYNNREGFLFFTFLLMTCRSKTWYNNILFCKWFNLFCKYNKNILWPWNFDSSQNLTNLAKFINSRHTVLFANDIWHMVTFNDKSNSEEILSCVMKLYLNTQDKMDKQIASHTSPAQMLSNHFWMKQAPHQKIEIQHIG